MAGTWLILSALFCALQLSRGPFSKHLTEKEERHYLELNAPEYPDRTEFAIRNNAGRNFLHRTIVSGVQTCRQATARFAISGKPG